MKIGKYRYLEGRFKVFEPARFPEKGFKEKKVVVKTENRRKRLPWCLEKRRWVVDGNWNKVIFSDESQIVIGTSNRIYLP